ncbi:hypothetical protein tb265_03780 [Gemmatimonadetes bacterium T265]|nr:hypothetical protein tb265_03780 [Gemmatimonadetes bacterium T265]
MDGRLNADALPAGYVPLDPLPPGTAAVVCRAEVAAVVRDVVAHWGTLYAYAAAHPARRELRGRAAAYAVPLGADADGRTRSVVVRHGWRGGALRRLRRDLFFPPTRAPVELATSARLRAAGVPTPEVIAYAVYPATAGLRRVDVATALVPDGIDLAALLLASTRDPADDGETWVRPTAALLAALARAGARHPDLNLKNVLLAPAPGGRVVPGARAWVLDVDVARVLAAAGAPAAAGAALAANFGRLARSVRKWAAANVADADVRARLDDALQALGSRARAELARADRGAAALPPSAAPARA